MFPRVPGTGHTGCRVSRISFFFVWFGVVIEGRAPRTLSLSLISSPLPLGPPIINTTTGTISSISSEERLAARAVPID